MILLDPDARPIIGHRGASGSWPENTLGGFAAAVAEGADALELDVRLTADGIPVVIHDEAVDRTTDGRGPVASLTLEALRRLDAGRGERVPTLDQVLERFAGNPLIVEVKEVRAAEPTRRVLERHGAAGRVLVGSFVEGAHRPFRRAPWLRSASRRETAWSWAASRLVLGGRPSGYCAFTLPERYAGLHLVDQRFVRLARRMGRPVHVWTVDRREDAERLWAIGVSGIITNYPARMLG